MLKTHAWYAYCAIYKLRNFPYLNFLKGGSSDYPVQLLKKAGVDMSSTAPVKAAIKKFDQLLGELEELLKTC